MTKPVTFPSLESYLDIVATSGMTVHTQLDFRTHDDGLLLFHPMDAEGAGIVVGVALCLQAWWVWLGWWYEEWLRVGRQ